MYILACGIVSIISAAAIGDYTNRDISGEHHVAGDGEPTHAPA